MKSACIEFKGAKSRGYGVKRRNGRNLRVHRLVYASAHFNGSMAELDATGLFVCHHCDNPACINIDHLWLGTSLENVRDSVKKGRHTKGEFHGNAKLTLDQVRKIRIRYAEGGITQKTLGREHGVVRMTILRIINNQTYQQQ